MFGIGRMNSQVVVAGDPQGIPSLDSNVTKLSKLTTIFCNLERLFKHFMVIFNGYFGLCLDQCALDAII